MGTDLTTFIPRAAPGVTVSIVWERDLDEVGIHIGHENGYTVIRVSARVARKISQALRPPGADSVSWVRGLESAGEVLPDVHNP
jgi:hypothetical protein